MQFFTCPLSQLIPIHFPWFLELVTNLVDHPVIPRCSYLVLNAFQHRLCSRCPPYFFLASFTDHCCLLTISALFILHMTLTSLLKMMVTMFLLVLWICYRPWLSVSLFQPSNELVPPWNQFFVPGASKPAPKLPWWTRGITDLGTW